MAKNRHKRSHRKDRVFMARPAWLPPPITPLGKISGGFLARSRAALVNLTLPEGERSDKVELHFVALSAVFCATDILCEKSRYALEDPAVFSNAISTCIDVYARQPHGNLHANDKEAFLLLDALQRVEACWLYFTEAQRIRALDLAEQKLQEAVFAARAVISQRRDPPELRAQQSA
jgi:hypothetical protein